MTKYSIIILCFLISQFAAFGQQLQVMHYDRKEGYPPYSCGYMMQGRDGWMWFSAGYEIVRYDGHRFNNYPPANGVQFNFAFGLFEVDDEIWINAIPYMLKVSGDSLRRLDIKNNFLPPSVVSDNISDVLKHHGQYYFLCNNGLYTLQNRELKPLITSDKIYLSGYESLYAFNDSILVGYDVDKKKVIVFNLNQHIFKYPQKKVWDMQEHEGAIYLAKPGKGIFQVKGIKIHNDEVEVKSERIVPLNLNSSFKFFEVDGQGNFWVFFKNDKIIKVTPGGQTQAVSKMDGLQGFSFLKSFVDRENNLWLAARTNLVKVSGQQWNRFTKSDGLLSNSLGSIGHGLKKGQLLIKTSLGTNIKDNHGIHTVLKEGKPFTGSIIQLNRSKTLYFLHNQLFSAVFNPIDFTLSKDKMLAQFPTPVITSAVDKYGNVYLACHDGLYVYADGKKKKLNYKTYKALFFDSHERLWAGQFSSELHCFRVSYIDSTLHTLFLFKMDAIGKGKPRINAIRAITETPGENIIIGTRYNGLFILTLKNDKVIQSQFFDKSKGLASNNVWDLSIDGDGTCWIATSGGINSLKYSDGQWKMKDESKSRKINETLTIQATGNNKIWVSNFPGLISFNPKEQHTVFPFSAAITALKINGKKAIPGKINQLKADENDISIAFSANTYRFENEVGYSWRLTDKGEWSKLSNSHTIHFSALKPGKYHFSVKARDAYGNWSKNQAGFLFTILPPFWQQAWFIIITSILGIAILYFIYRNRILQLKKVENLRSHIARDLHDEIGSTLTSIHILSKISRLSLKANKEKSDELLQKVINQSHQIQQNMSDIVWTIKPDNDLMKNMVAHMREYLAETLEPADVAIHFSVEEPLLQKTLAMKDRRDFFLIFKEAISNVARHSKARHVYITLSLKKGWIYLKVFDDGLGLSDCNIQSGNGLQNMKERAVSLKGGLLVYNARDGGCCIELKIPAT